MLIENVRVLQNNEFSPPDWSVRVADGAIRAIGPDLDRTGSGEPSIDMGGRWLLPGLINSHTHIVIDEADLSIPRKHYPRGELLGVLEAAQRGQRTLEAGITTIRDCNGPGAGVFALRAAFAERTLPGPRIFASGQAICATGGHMHAISFEADGPDEVRRGVRQQIKSGADFIKLVAEASSASGALEAPRLQLTVSEMAAGVGAAHRLGKRVTVHAMSQTGVAGAVEAGVDSIEHGYDIADSTLDLMADHGVWLVPTLSVQSAISTHGLDMGLSKELTDRSSSYLELGLATVSRARERGVRIACGSDAGSPLNSITDLVTEMRLLVEAGFSPLGAVHAATEESAALLGVDDHIGSIAVGKSADLILVDADPGSDVRALAEVRVVMKEGEIIVDYRERQATET